MNSMLTIQQEADQVTKSGTRVDYLK